MLMTETTAMVTLMITMPMLTAHIDGSINDADDVNSNDELTLLILMQMTIVYDDADGDSDDDDDEGDDDDDADDDGDNCEAFLPSRPISASSPYLSSE